MVNKQSFLNAIEQNIDMVRGDTLCFNFQIKGLEEAEPNFTFAGVQKYDQEPLFECSLNDGVELSSYDTTQDTATYTVTLDPTKTIGLDTGLYYYSLTMFLEDNVLTLMRGKLNLLNEIERG